MTQIPTPDSTTPAAAPEVGAAAMACSSAWVFDVDACLVDSLTGTSLRPLAEPLLERLRALGVHTVLWSAAGQEYARRRADQVGVDHLFDGFLGKVAQDAEGRWCCSEVLDLGHGHVTFVDDRPHELGECGRTIGVNPYLAPRPHDRGLAPVLELVEREYGSGE